MKEMLKNAITEITQGHYHPSVSTETKKNKNFKLVCCCLPVRYQLYHTLWDRLAKTKSFMTQPENDDELNEHTFYICLWLAEPTTLSKWLILTVLQCVTQWVFWMCNSEMILQNKRLSESWFLISAEIA